VGAALQCVTGLRDYGGQGCILADDMGLGKTLQGIALLWTMLKQGFDGQPMAKRVLIVCPTSLVSNWDQECDKVSSRAPRRLPR
jgi:DNA repair and recombination RAD54-like protein